MKRILAILLLCLPLTASRYVFVMIRVDASNGDQQKVFSKLKKITHGEHSQDIWDFDHAQPYIHPITAPIGWHGWCIDDEGREFGISTNRLWGWAETNVTELSKLVIFRGDGPGALDSHGFLQHTNGVIDE